MDIRLIATGGTFDKQYDPATGELGFATSCLPELLAQARLDPSPPIDVLMQIDSLDMTHAQRAQILQACQQAPESRLLVIHGTDTLTDTAAVLAQAGLDKTIVLTGAMVPARIQQSDAAFNLGAAIASASLLPAGVWICIGARAYPWDALRKDRAQARFVPIAAGSAD